MSSIVKMNGLRLEKYLQFSQPEAVGPRPRGLGIALSRPFSVRAIGQSEDVELSGTKAKGKSRKFGPGSIVELDFGTVRPQRYEALLNYSPALYALGMVSAPTLIPSNEATPVKVVIQLFESFNLPEDDALVTIFLVD